MLGKLHRLADSRLRKEIDQPRRRLEPESSGHRGLFAKRGAVHFWEMERRPLYFGQAGVIHAVPKRCGIVRKETSAARNPSTVLGIVAEDYTPLQNREAIGDLSPRFKHRLLVSVKPIEQVLADAELLIEHCVTRQR